MESLLLHWRISAAAFWLLLCTTGITLVACSMPGNSFTGDVPSFQEMSNLQWFILIENYLGSGQANDLDFPCSLTNCTYLRYLDIGENNFGEAVPKFIGNLSITLYELVLQVNALSGAIPSSIANLINLERLELLDLAKNKLAGAIPPEIMSLSSLSIYANFSDYNLAGELPREIENLKNLGHLHLFGNRLSGEIPNTLGSSISLEYLYMQGNMFTGPIPLTLSSH
ncbi:hypothetical protein CRG98_020116 [Punica granatum]|uniref:non-specific serine/threonine protein kinase n=1 Tax=Punica granatum TaxID=22663 RepID=A0A2I0JT56_PUNGR|nr:hypothetical protein CRG98_020116 [Punica granatum]